MASHQLTPFVLGLDSTSEVSVATDDCKAVSPDKDASTDECKYDIVERRIIQDMPTQTCPRVDISHYPDFQSALSLFS